MSLSKLHIPTLALSVLFCLASLPALADSHVRIVRLSYIDGGVQVSRADTHEYQKAMTNLPIAEGMKLRTADDGKAEVEFEDGSTLHIVPDSIVEFSQLSLRDSGSKVTGVEVTRGTAYLNFTGMKDDEFSVQFGKEKIELHRAAHLRVDLGYQNDSVAVFKGVIQVDGPNGAVELKKNQTLNFDASENGGYKLAKNIRDEPWDDWDDQQNQYHDRYAKAYSSYSPYAYGSADLSYYGSFFNYPGYGILWQPYFAGIGWDPFMDGAWMFYPGWGYGWVSGYPWGWTPYHYGTWTFLAGRGWAWQPGGTWNPWYRQPLVANAPKGFVAPHAPTAGTSLVMVNRGTISTFAGSTLVLRNNSAGLGVPRGQFDHMSKLSQKVETHGSVNQRVEPVTMNSPARIGAGEMGPGMQGRSNTRMGSSSASRGSAPPAMHQTMSSPPMSAPSSRGSSAPAGGPAHK
ncbi:MAG TPA: FecR family protein [Terriglobales bacterium]|nr:FecR family protein [Terriglobales bacterium]